MKQFWVWQAKRRRERRQVYGEQRQKHRLYIGRGRLTEKRGENRTDMGTRGEKKGEVQKQQELMKQEQPVVLSCDACENGRCKTPFWCLQLQKAAFACVKSSLQTLPGWSAALYVCSGSPGIQGISQPRSHSLSSVTLATYFLHGNSISRFAHQRKGEVLYVSRLKFKDLISRLSLHCSARLTV